MNLEQIVPREHAGSSTQSRFDYQREFIVYQCINMLENPEIAKIYCDFHDDCVVKDNSGLHTFYQVKGLKNKLFSASIFKKEALDGMFYNFCLADGQCKSVLVTNTQIDPDLRRIIESKDNLHRNIATPEEKQILDSVKNEWSKIVHDEKGLLGKFVEEFEIMDSFPSFPETVEGNATLRVFNINWLKSVLDNTLNNNFSIHDATIIHDIIYKEVQVRSLLSTRSNRFVTKEQILNKIEIPPFLRTNFSRKFTKEEIEKIKDQSILEGKLEQGGFSPYFIKNAKLVRCVTLFSREKLSKIRSIGNLIDDFEYRLTDICLDVFEEHAQRNVFNSHEMLNDLQAKLLALATEDKYKRLNLEPNFVKGLVWEATSQCKFRWDNGRKK